MSLEKLASELSPFLRGDLHIGEQELFITLDNEEIELAEDQEFGRFVLSAKLADFPSHERDAAARAAIAVNEQSVFETATIVAIPWGTDFAILGRSFETERSDGARLHSELQDFVQKIIPQRAAFERERMKPMSADGDRESLQLMTEAIRI